jgi:hypothetical protein
VVLPEEFQTAFREAYQQVLPEERRGAYHRCRPEEAEW